MNGKAAKSKIFSIDESALWIEALAPQDGGGVAPGDTITFQTSSISHIRSLGPKHCFISLHTGVEVLLSIPKAELLARLQSPEGGVLDLTADACSERKADLVNRLREEFRAAAEDARYAAVENMTVHAWVRPAGKAEFSQFTFSGQDIFAREITESSSILGGKNISIRMKGEGKGPFGGAEFIMECTLAEFRRICEKAYAAGLREIFLEEFPGSKDAKPAAGGTPPAPRRGQP